MSIKFNSDGSATITTANGTLNVGREDVARRLLSEGKLLDGARVSVDPNGGQPFGPDYPVRPGVPHVSVGASVDARALADSQSGGACSTSEMLKQGMCDAESIVLAQCVSRTGNIPVALTSDGAIVKQPDFRQGGRTGGALIDNSRLVPLFAPLPKVRAGVNLDGGVGKEWALPFFTSEVIDGQYIIGYRLWFTRKVLSTTQASISVYGDPQYVSPAGKRPLPPAGLFRNQDAIRGNAVASLDIQIESYTESIDLPLFFKDGKSMDVANLEIGRLVPIPAIKAFNYFTTAGALVGWPGASLIVTSDSPLDGCKCAPIALNAVDAPDSISRLVSAAIGGGR